MEVNLVGDRITDAKIWAEEFMKVVNKIGAEKIDEGLMISWFASAIVTAQDSYSPGNCSICKYSEHTDNNEIVCSRGRFDPIEPWFYCSDFKDGSIPKED